jgi:hypothetical protein
MSQGRDNPQLNSQKEDVVVRGVSGVWGFDCGAIFRPQGGVSIQSASRHNNDHHWLGAHPPSLQIDIMSD